LYVCTVRMYMQLKLQLYVVLPYLHAKTVKQWSKLVCLHILGWSTRVSYLAVQPNLSYEEKQSEKNNWFLFLERNRDKIMQLDNILIIILYISLVSVLRFG
jgi:hypothetical protein